MHIQFHQEEETVKDFGEAQQAHELRKQITEYAEEAAYSGVDRDWVNRRLVAIGAQPVTGTAKYQINAPITGAYGTTVTAASRAEALEKFNQYLQNIIDQGEIAGFHYGDGVYYVQSAGEAQFFSGPEDPPVVDPDNIPDLAGTREGIRALLKDAVTSQGWGYSYAASALEDMGLEPLPKLVPRTVQVPVSGTAQMKVMVFEGDDDEAVRKAVQGHIRSTGSVSVVPDEVGAPFTDRSDLAESMGLKIVDDE